MKTRIIVFVIMLICMITTITQNAFAQSADDRFIGYVGGHPYYASDIHELESHFGARFWQAYKNDKGFSAQDIAIDFKRINIYEYLQRLVKLEKMRIEYAQNDPLLLTAKEKQETSAVAPAATPSVVATTVPAKPAKESDRVTITAIANSIRENQLKERQQFWAIKLKNENIEQVCYSNKLKKMPKVADRMVDSAPSKDYKVIDKVNGVEYKQFTDHLPDGKPIVAYTNSPYPELF